MTTLTPEERAALQVQLADAQRQYHLLQTGKQARVVVDQNGERVEFTAANRMSLYGYIQQLQGLLGTPSAAFAAAGPARFVF